jgi:hypothetical protein
VPKAQAALARKALAKLEGLPRRATVMLNGVPDAELTAKLGAALDTTDCVDGGDDDGSSVCFELPASLEKHLGRTVTVDKQSVTLPTADKLVADEAALPATLRAVRQAKRDAAVLADKPAVRSK